jgi:hypothetical protein
MLVGPDAFYRVASALRVAALDRLQAETRPVPSRSYVTTGQVAWDVCDCDGQLAVSVVQTWLAPSFPAPVGGSLLPPCELPYRVADVQVHLIRCAANPDDTGVPSAADLDWSGRQVIQDAWTVTAGVQCSLADMQAADDIAEYLVGASRSAGPQGGCVGSTLSLQVGLNNVCPCE